MYIHMPADTAATFEEAMRHLAVNCYTRQNLYRQDPVRDPEFFMEFAGLFSEGLKLSGANPRPNEMGWDLEEETACVIIPEHQARQLMLAMVDLPTPEAEFESIYCFADIECGPDAIEALAVAMHAVVRLVGQQLAKSATERPGPELQPTA